MFETERERDWESIRRDRPLGDRIWTLAAAKDLCLEYSLHPRGRPPLSHQDWPGPTTAPGPALKSEATHQRRRSVVFPYFLNFL
jgi:hypothetical protein